MPRKGDEKPSQSFDTLDALLAALNRSGERVQALWFTFLTLTLYFAIASGTTTHKMLLLREGLSLPLVNLQLPLLGFYVVAPLFYAAVHAYFLLMLVLLARTAKGFEYELLRALPGDGHEVSRDRFRARVANTLFLQILSGPGRARTGLNGFALRGIALLSLSLAPLAVLLTMQFVFLPYHHPWITWWHRGMVMVDLLLVWTLWPAYLHEWGARLLPRLEIRWRMMAKALTSSVVVMLSLGIGSYPGEQIHNTRVEQWANKVWPNFNHLSLAMEDLSDDDARARLVAQNKDGNHSRDVYVLSLAGRNLVAADFSGADLRLADFREAELRGAQFDGSWLQGSNFVEANGERASFRGAQLRGAWLAGASLRQASFSKAGAEGAVFARASLQEAGFEFAQIQGASLDQTNLSGTDFYGAQAQGASLYRAVLKGAKLDGAIFSGAVFYFAKMQAASLDSADLQGATLLNAQLQGASLEGTQLQGAALEGAQFQAATLVDVSVWRALATDPFTRRNDFVPMEEGAYTEGRDANGREWRKRSELSTAAAEIRTLDSPSSSRPANLSFEEWLTALLEKIPAGVYRNAAAMRLAVLNPAIPAPKDGFSPEFWIGASKDSMESADYQEQYSTVITELVCSDEAPGYVAEAMVRELPDIERGQMGYYSYSHGGSSPVESLRFNVQPRSEKEGAVRSWGNYPDRDGSRDRIFSLDEQHIRRLVTRFKGPTDITRSQSGSCPGARFISAYDVKKMEILIECVAARASVCSPP